MRIGIGLHLGLNQHGIAETPAPAPSPTAPAITASSITGTPEDGQTLTAHYTATGYPTPTPDYQWQVNGTDISGETGATIALDEAGMGLVDADTISCEIIVTNTEGSDTAEPTIAYVGAGAPSAPVLSDLSTGWTAGDNPPSWQSVYSGATEYDSNTGTGSRVRAVFTFAGVTTTTAWVPLDIAALTAGVSYPEVAAYNFSAGGAFSVYEEMDYVVADVEQSISGHSNTWSDTLNSTPVQVTYAPGTSGGGTAGSTTGTTAISFPTLVFPAGRYLVMISACSINGTLDSLPTGLTLTPTGGGTAITLTLLGSDHRGTLISRAAALYASSTDLPGGSYTLTGTRPNAAGTALTFGSVVGSNMTLSAGPTFTSATNEANPHLTASLTVPAYGLELGWLMNETTTAATANAPSTLISEIRVAAGAPTGFGLASRTTTGAVSLSTLQTSVLKCAVVFAPV